MRIRTWLVAGLVAALGVPRGARGEESGADGPTLRVALTSFPDSLDPARADEDEELLCLGHVYETLYMPEPFLRPFVLAPRLAAALPMVSADGLTWRISLRRDARFPISRDRPVRASDVVFSWLRLMDAHKASPSAWHLEGRIEGLDAFVDASRGIPANPARSAYGAEEGYPAVGGLRALDDHTLEIRLTAPFPDFGWVLCHPALSVVPFEAVAHFGSRLGEHPVGSGPFRLASLDKEHQVLTFARSGDWRTERIPATAPEGLRGRLIPRLEAVVARVLVDPVAKVEAFSCGALDQISIPKDFMRAFVAPGSTGLRPGLAARGLVLEKVPRLEVIYDCFNFDDPVLGRAAGEKGRAIRRALSLVSDIPWAAKVLYDGLAEEIAGPILPEMPEFDAAFVNPWKRGPGETLEQARERARKVLADAGMPGGQGVPPLKYDVGDSTLDEQFFEAFKRDAATVGLVVEPFRTTWREQIRRQREAKFEITGLAWGADYCTAQNFLQLFYGPNRAPGCNSSNFADPSFDALYVQAERLPPGPERTTLYRKMQAIAVDEVAWIVRYRRLQWSVRHPWTSGPAPADLLVAPWAFADVDYTRRAQGLSSTPR